MFCGPATYHPLHHGIIFAGVSTTKPGGLLHDALFSCRVIIYRREKFILTTSTNLSYTHAVPEHCKARKSSWRYYSRNCAVVSIGGYFSIQPALNKLPNMLYQQRLPEQPSARIGAAYSRGFCAGTSLLTTRARWKKPSAIAGGLERTNVTFTHCRYGLFILGHVTALRSLSKPARLLGLLNGTNIS
ncbi:hypothetical protein OSTOST_07748, partial [Ostertagia ostertagi]